MAMDGTVYCLLLLTINLTFFLAFFASFNSAADPDMLQDFCVADLNSEFRVNGFPCKPDAVVTSSDFFATILSTPSNTNNTLGFAVASATVRRFPGLNTLGISFVRIDLAPGGMTPLHIHPRATEIIFVLEGTVDAGFITTGRKYFQHIVKKGEVFVIPQGLIHFQKNVGDSPATVIAAFNSQLQGTLGIPGGLFASSPEIPDDYLARGFRIQTEVVRHIKNMF